MKIYHFKRTDGWAYDEHDGFVIVAVNEIQAHNLAHATEAYYENWVDEHSEITEIGVYTGTRQEPFLVLSSFNAG